MIPGGSSYMDVPEFHPSNQDSSPIGSSTESENSQLSKKIASSVSKLGLSSTGSMHELLECPVCTNSMYPPIHQVISLDFKLKKFLHHYRNIR